MPGQLCSGSVESEHAPIKMSRSYCEGMAYRTTGVLLDAPKADNPHLAGTPEADAWDLGWDAAETHTGSTISVATAGCCALVGAAVVAI